jgi:hypothetical protein
MLKIVDKAQSEVHVKQRVILDLQIQWNRVFLESPYLLSQSSRHSYGVRTFLTVFKTNSVI